jgi:TRAP-type mannitol/chloroaromatic compound transport system substrate-binding protein
MQECCPNIIKKINNIALKKMPKNVKLVRFSDDILKVAQEATNKELISLSKEKSFSEVYTKWKDFRSEMNWISSIK